MFHMEGFVFIAVLCVTKAAFTVDIPENNVREVEKCVNKICDQQCQQMGFAVGNCVGFTCECDKFTKSNDIEEDLTAADENATDELLSDCNPAACDQLCRRLKFPGGVCVNGRCKCDNFRQDIELANDDFNTADTNAIKEELSDCNLAACDQLCRRLKFPGGACVNGRCKCDNFRQVLEIFLNNDFKAVDKNDIGEELSDCNPAACDQLCRRLKFPGGVCVNGRCKCDNFRQDLEFVVNSYFKASEENDVGEELSDCNPSACDQLCRRLKFPGGACVNGRCKCDNFRQDLEIFVDNDYKSVDNNDIGEELSDCNPAACDQLCRRLKFPGGVCVNGRCKCDNFRQHLEPIVKYQIGAVRSCVNAICNQICRRLGFLSGVCAGERCECSNFLTQNNQLEQIAYIKVDKDEDEISNEVSVCDPSSCNSFCHLINYQRGICLSGKCWCTNSLKAEGSREKILKQPVCDARKCNIRCRNMHYMGGFCQLYKCVCY